MATDQRLPRKLAAILYADVAGYSRLTGQDEDATHRNLKDSLDLIAHTVESHHGRVMHYAGDAVLAMFDAVVDAMSCAAAIQRDIDANQADTSEERKVRFRIGLNLGDVIEDRGDIYGDGVNVAARLESLAEPGGICISESVYTAVGSKLPLEYEDLGDREVKNIENPVRVYRAKLQDGVDLPEPVSAAQAKPTLRSLVTTAAIILVLGVAVLAWLKPWDPETGSVSASARPLPLPDKPSVVVLPLKNLSGDPDQEILSSAISEDLTGELSRFAELFVISADSANFYADGKKTPKEIGRELGVKYVLAGSMQGADDRLRVSMKLIEAESEAQIWTQKYDRIISDLFVVQDEIVRSVTSSLGETIWRNAAVGLERKPLANFEAYDYYLKGKESLHKLNKEANEEARLLWQKAIELDPDLGYPYLGMAWTYFLDYRAQWVKTGPEALDLAAAYLDRAADKLGDHYAVHRLRSKISQVRGGLDRAMVQIKRALELNPNDGDLLATYAQMLYYTGKRAEALAWIDDAIRRNPHYPSWYASTRAFILYLQNDYQAAVAELNKIGSPVVWDHRLLAAGYAQLGREDKARLHVDKLLEDDPGFSVAAFAPSLGFQRDVDKELFLDGLRKAGLPE